MTFVSPTHSIAGGKKEEEEEEEEKKKRKSDPVKRPGVAQRVGGQQHAPGALYPGEKPGTHFAGGWVGGSAGPDERKISSPPGFESSPLSVAIPTELPGPQTLVVFDEK